jgi:pilus assembly protein Flp/PilA
MHDAAITVFEAMKLKRARCIVMQGSVLIARFARKEVVSMGRLFDRRQSGQGMVEYALILVLVSIVVIVILLTMGNQIQNVFSNVVAALG